MYRQFFMICMVFKLPIVFVPKETNVIDISAHLCFLRHSHIPYMSMHVYTIRAGITVQEYAKSTGYKNMFNLLK